MQVNSIPSCNFVLGRTLGFSIDDHLLPLNCCGMLLGLPPAPAPIHANTVLPVPTLNKILYITYYAPVCVFPTKTTNNVTIAIDETVFVKNSSPLPTVGRLSANCRPTDGRQLGNSWPTVGQQSATVGRQSADCRPTVGCLLADSWPTVGRQFYQFLSVICRPTVGDMLVDYR